MKLELLVAIHITTTGLEELEGMLGVIVLSRLAGFMILEFKHSTEDCRLIMGKVMLLYFKNQDSYIVCTRGQTFSENDRNSLSVF